MIEIPTPSIWCDLSVTALERAIIDYEEKHASKPTTLLYGRNDGPTALKMRYGTFPAFACIRYWIEVPDMPDCMWLVVGLEGLYGSPGA